MSSVAEWQIIELEVPPEIQQVLDLIADALDAIAAFLELVAAFLELVATLIQLALDLYVALVNAFIDALQNLLNDLRYAGIYVFLDYPNTLSLADFNPAAESTLAGTIFDPDFLDGVEDQEELLAIAAKRKSWARQQKSFLSFDTAIARINASFVDQLDHLKPPYSETANTYGVVIMGYSEEVVLYLKIVRQFYNLFALNDLGQVLAPGFDQWLEDFEGGIEDLTSVDWCDFNFVVPFTFRNAGTFPNWIGRYTLQDLIPPLGELLRALSNLLELLRPNGAITDFIQALIDALLKKVERLRQLAETLAELADALRNAFSGTKLSVVTVESSTGNNGFINGLRSATGHPGFDEALVVSLVLYAGGPNIEPLKLLFGVQGEKMVDDYVDATEGAVEDYEDGEPTTPTTPIVTP